MYLLNQGLHYLSKEKDTTGFFKYSMVGFILLHMEPIY